MKPFTFTGTVTISIHTEVEAETEAEARKIAFSRGFCNISQPQRHGQSANEVWVHSGEIDGTPENVVTEQ
jgi:hypothetical protein